MIKQSWIDFIRFCLDEQMDIPSSVDSIDWDSFYLFAKEQAIVGIVFEGLKRIHSKDAGILKKVMLRWFAASEKIRKQNIKINTTVVILTDLIKQDGFDSCLLKGQGNNLLYPYFYSRTPGDIDIWITPMNEYDRESDRHLACLHYLRKKYPQGNLHYNHIDAGFYNGISVEVHHRPRFMNNMFYNHRLQMWINRMRNEQFNNVRQLPETTSDIAVPTTEFNIVFQLAHIYGHVIQKGIGLRHIIDYYYVLKSRQVLDNRTSVEKTLNHLGLWKIARAVMWILHHKMGLGEKWLIAPMDSTSGSMMWNEILIGGNFGYFDKREDNASTPLANNWQRLKRDLRMMRFFPSECCWEPIFRIYHYFWRLRYN